MIKFKLLQATSQNIEIKTEIKSNFTALVSISIINKENKTIFTQTGQQIKAIKLPLKGKWLV